MSRLSLLDVGVNALRCSERRQCGMSEVFWQRLRDFGRLTKTPFSYSLLGLAAEFDYR